ncbi:MAG: nicotinate phosphoribosyltransferase, partial [Oligoflexia bacterium]|nr:nicotinate phosphoribosyltransferase [Oligoflexia bacterium]
MHTPSRPPVAQGPGITGLVPEYFQLVQAAVYHADGMWGQATFDLYVKDAPLNHGFLVAAGIETAVNAILQTSFSADFVAWLRQQIQFARIGERFFHELGEFHFEGDILAVPEGTTVFPGEPLLRLTAPLTQAGLFGAGLIQLISQATGVATRAARLCLAA